MRQLEYFIASASEMNFSRAAHRVRVVQSALSTSVGKLEKELGVELFDRSRQQITITPAGELFREHARRVIHAARLAKDAMGDYRGQLSGIVEFGSLISFSTLDVPEILGQFHRDYPLVQIRLRNSLAGRAAHLTAIADGSLDLADPRVVHPGVHGADFGGSDSVRARSETVDGLGPGRRGSCQRELTDSR